MARKDRIYAVVWTWRQHEIVQTKKAGHERMRAWRERYITKGWTAHWRGQDAVIATSPDGEQHAAVLHEYDAATQERIYRPLPKIGMPEPKPEKPKKTYRKGRKPVGV